MQKIAAVVIPFGACIAVLASCLAPTETTLILSTDVDCASRRPSTAIYTGAVHDTDPTSPRTITSQCDPQGKIGTLVVVPENTGEFQVDVVTALDGADPTKCATHPEKCITSRRRVTSLKHTPLTLPIENDLDCLGISCNPASTCYRGMCVNATMDPGACASAEGCLPNADGGVRPNASDGAAPDGPITVPDAVPPDATPGPLADAAGDGESSDASEAGTLPDGGKLPDGGVIADAAGVPDTGTPPDAGGLPDTGGAPETGAPDTGVTVDGGV
jgi:hypothetical protein